MNRLKTGLLVAIMTLVGVGAAMGVDLTVASETILPESIPVDGSTASVESVPVLRLDLNETPPPKDGVTQEVESVTVELLGATATDVVGVSLYYAPQGSTGTEGADSVWDGIANEAAPIATGDFTTNPVTIVFPSPLEIPLHNATANLYITFDVSHQADPLRQIGAAITEISAKDSTEGTYTSLANAAWTTSGSTYGQIDSYDVTLTGTTPPLPAGAVPGDIVTALKMDFGVADASLLASGHTTVSSVTLTRTGTAEDSDARVVRIFSDVVGGTAGVYDDGTDVLYGSGTMTSGVVDVTLSTPLSLGNGEAGHTLEYYVDIAVATGATSGRTVGLQIADPSTDIGFADGIDDTAETFFGATYQPLQLGTISDPTSQPATPSTFTTQDAPDNEAPTVASTNPAGGQVEVDNEADVTVTFSEPMDPISAADITIIGSYSGTIDANADGLFSFNTSTRQSISFAKTTAYQFAETITVTISGTVTDESTEQNQLAGDGTNPGTDYSFSFTIEPNLPPAVLGWVPTRDSADVSVGTTVSVIFSEAMDAATVLASANFALIADGQTEPVVGVMTYDSDTNTATFTPEESLEYRTLYTATVTTGMRDTDGASLTASDSAAFTTVQQFPDFAEPIVTNNRIQPGSTDPLRIFVATPSGFEGTESVSIQVFTATGRRVATLTAAGETFEDVIARQPVVWDGTNGRGQPLGPGLYFVQVRSGGYRRAMRVVIVR